MSRRHLTTLTLLAAALSSAADASAATFGAPRVLSATAQVQANATSLSIALTPDGRYAVLYTAASNLYPEPAVGETRAGAILRFDLDDPAAAPVVVAYNSSKFPSSQVIAASTQPSVSADGRFVAFSTLQKLIPTDGNGVEDVYVRDLSLPISDPAAFQLVSAVDGSATKPITYALSQGGSTATRGAISADGTKVVFTVNATSNVAGANTPRRQVVVRDLTTLSTKVVSLGITGKPVGDQGRNTNLSPSPMISGDGSTVIWNSAYVWGTTNLPGLLPGPAYLNSFNANAVWRRIADGPSSPVRLVLTAADPEDPACPSVVLTTSLVPGPCDGPIGLTTDDSDPQRVRPMALSADGRRVLIATGNPRTNVPSTLIPDAYVVDLRDGVSRKQGTRRLSFGPESSVGAGVTDVSLSPDGRFAAFAAPRLRPTASPSPVGEIPSPGSIGQLYLVDLEADALQTLSTSWSKEPVDGNTFAPALSQSARRIAFLSDATNLFFGDGNRVGDALVLTATTSTTQRPQDEPDQAAASSLLPAPLPAEQVPVDERLGVTARARPDGTVQLSAAVPAAGQLTISVRERRLVRSTSRRRARAARRITADATTTATQAGRLQLTLTPLRTWSRQLRRAGGVPATIRVQFAPAGSARPALSKSIAVTFRRTSAAAPTKANRR